jgi:hemoglobin-like flavoprotein
MALDADLLRSSFELVVSRRPDLTMRFYEHLFARNPELEALFSRNPRELQARMLAEALGAVLDHLDDAAWLTDALGARALGRKHVGYGVTDAMYDHVGAALLATLAEVAASDWTDALAAEWGAAYGAIAGLMRAGAR